MKTALRKVYASLPFKQALFTLIRAIVPLPETIFKHLHFTGVFRVKVSSSESFLIEHHGHIIENELFWKGLKGWERVSLELWVRLSREAEVIFDIGANTGVYALISHAVNPSAVIFAAEPMAPIHAKLLHNLTLNKAKVHALSCAISDHDGVAEIYQDPQNAHMLDASLNPAYDAGNTALRPLTVPTRTVARILEEHGLKSVDLLKIDVETHEPEVLAGFISLIRRDRLTMLIEILNDRVADRASAMVDGLGYQYFNIDDRTWPPPQVTTLTKSDHFISCCANRRSQSGSGFDVGMHFGPTGSVIPTEGSERDHFRALSFRLARFVQFFTGGLPGPSQHHPVMTVRSHG